MRIACFGQKRCGKTTSGNWLEQEHSFIRFSFARKLKKIVQDVWSFTDSEMERKGPKVRGLLQSFATKLREIDNFVWVNNLARELQPAYQTNCNIVIDDLRFSNEEDYLRENGFVLIKIIRTDFEEKDKFSKHISETEMELIKPDWVVYAKTGEIIPRFKELYEFITSRMVKEDGKSLV